MPDLSQEPARVKRARAMELLAIDDDRVFRKVVDANPQLLHKLPGEKKGRYLTAEIAKLLEPSKTGVRPGLGGCQAAQANKQKPRPRTL